MITSNVLKTVAEFEFTPFDNHIPVQEQQRIISALRMQDIDFYNDTWDVSKWYKRRTTGKNAVHITFKKMHHLSKDIPVWTKNYIKFMIAKLHIDKGYPYESLREKFKALKYFASYLNEKECHSLKEIDKDILISFENYVINSSLSHIYKRSLLKSVELFLKLLCLDIDWRCPRIIDPDNSHNCHIYAKNLKGKKIPEEVILQILSAAGQLMSSRQEKIFSGTWNYMDEYDLLTSGALLLQLATYSRINEILTMSLECELIDSKGYGLKIIAEKSNEPIIKPVVPEYIETVKQIINSIKEITKISREYVTFWESIGESITLIGNQTISKSLFCYVLHPNRNYGVTEKLIDKLKAGNPKITIAEFKRLIILNNDKSIHTTWLLNKLPETIQAAHKQNTAYNLRDLGKLLIGTGDCFTYAKLNSNLNRKYKDHNFSKRYGISHNGKPYYINSHQIRHLTTTLMLNVGMAMPIVDKLHGRISPDQSKVYDHPNYAESFMREEMKKENTNLIEKMTENMDLQEFINKPITIKADIRDELLAIVKNKFVSGTKAKAYNKLCKQLENKKITDEEFKRAEWQFFPMFLIAPNRLGFCTHSWFERPCDYHYNCLLNKDNNICEDLTPFVHPKTLEILTTIKHDIIQSYNVLENRQESEGKRIWESNLKSKLDNIKQLEHDIKEQINTIHKEKFNEVNYLR